MIRKAMTEVERRRSDGQRLFEHRERRSSSEAILVQDALQRGRQGGNEPGGAPRGGARGLLCHDGGVLAHRRGPCPETAQGDCGGRHLEGRRGVCHHVDRARSRGTRRRARRRAISNAHRGCEEELPGFEGAFGNAHLSCRTAGLIRLPALVRGATANREK
jgi:hypothetical protein